MGVPLRKASLPSQRRRSGRESVLDAVADRVHKTRRPGAGLITGAIRPMARKLKTYQTSLGFFEQAIAAPSMKAALEAWGADSNLFHQGAAKESRDPDVIAATMAKPGVVLKRPVGSDGPFGEHAELPKNLGQDGGKKPARKPRPRRRSLLPGRTRRRTGRRLKRTNGSASAASARRQRRRRPGKRSANAGSRPSTRRKRLWTRRSRNTRSEWPRCAPKSRHRGEAEGRRRRLDEEEGRLKAALRRARGDG